MGTIRTTGKIRISLRNKDEIENILATIQHRCTKNTTDYDELVEEAAKADKLIRAEKKRLTGSSLVGLFRTEYFRAYRPRSVDFTLFEMVRTSKNWYLTEISRRKWWGKSRGWRVEVTPGSD